MSALLELQSAVSLLSLNISPRVFRYPWTMAFVTPSDTAVMESFMDKVKVRSKLGEGTTLILEKAFLSPLISLALHRKLQFPRQETRVSKAGH